MSPGVAGAGRYGPSGRAANTYEFERMISLAEARALIEANISPLPAVATPLAAALGRVLRHPVAAREDVPAFDRSAMDGYAIAADDPSEKFRIVAEIQPGLPPK